MRLTVARLLFIGVFIALTIFGFWQRLNLLPDNNWIETLVPFLAIWGLAIVAVIVAALLDACDGRVDSTIGSTSKFGAELDFLSDVFVMARFQPLFCTAGACRPSTA